jgi:Protein of unknown function (DUF2846)
MLAEGQMRRFYQVVVACGLLLLLGACAKTTAFEPQDQLLDTSQARIYFFRQTRSPTDMGGFTAADIRIDGKPIGTLAPGTSVYIVADRPEGTHKITVGRPGETAGFDADIQIEAATSYYFEIGPTVETNVAQAKLDALGIKGRPVAGRLTASSPFMLFSLDAIAGAGMITKLKAQQPQQPVGPPACETPSSALPPGFSNC